MKITFKSFYTVIMLPNAYGSKIFSKMTMLELKAYLLQCGVSVNGYLKPALVNIAIAVEKMMLPVDPNFEKEKDSQDNHKLIIHDTEIPDPFGSSYNLVNNLVISLLSDL